MSCRALVIVLTAGAILAACGGGGGGGGGPTDPNPPGTPAVVTVQLDEFAYDPRSVTIDPGQTVRWVLGGSDPTHTVTEIDGAFDSGFAFDTPGAAFQRTFTEADRNKTFNYACATHSDCCDMKGSIRVGDTAPPPNPGY
jgi:plastocyanin